MRRVLEPVVNMLSRAGARPDDLIDAVKLYCLRHLQVEVTRERGSPASTARVALMIGMSRSEVERLLGREDELAPIRGPDKYSMSRVLSGWYEDPRFTDFMGDPCDLPLKGKNGEPDMEELVARYGGAPLAYVIEQLVRSGSIYSLDTEGKEDHWRVSRREFIAKEQSIESLRTIAYSSRFFHLTMENNTNQAESDKWFQRVAYSEDGIPLSAVPLVRKFIVDACAKVLVDIDRMFIKHPEVQKAPQSEPRVTIGVGMYLFKDIWPGATGQASLR